MTLKDKIVEYSKSLGLNTIGFIPCRRFDELYKFYEDRKVKKLENEFEEKDIEKRINPNYYMEKGKTIISIAFPYLHDYEYKKNGFSIYTTGEDYHKVVGEYLKKICEFIKTLEGEAKFFVDSNSLPERYIAYLSGIGFIGKNNMIITEKYGSYVFLGEIITDLDIQCQDKRTFQDIEKFRECDSCKLCYNSCPTKAINSYNKNCNICMSYITQKKEIEDGFLKLMDGRIFGCDTCQICCPYNQDISYSTINRFYPLEFVEKFSTEDIINLNNKTFKETFKLTSCGWRGKNILIRNSLIKSVLNDKNSIEKYKFTSPQLEECKIRLLKLYRV